MFRGLNISSQNKKTPFDLATNERRNAKFNALASQLSSLLNRTAFIKSNQDDTQAIIQNQFAINFGNSLSQKFPTFYNISRKNN